MACFEWTMHCLWQVQGLASAQTALGSGTVSQKLSLGQAFKQIIRQEGLRALWKGNGVTIVHRLPYSAVNFWSYEHCLEWWARRYPSKGNPSHDVLRRLICGGLAGMLACTVVRTHPSDTPLIHIPSFYRLRHCILPFCDIVRSCQVCFYTAYGVLFWLQSNGICVSFAAWLSNKCRCCNGCWCGRPALRLHIPAPCPFSAVFHCFTPCIAYCYQAYPLDLVRTRFAAQTTKRYYLGINHALQTIVQEEGLRGLYRGLGATLCQVAPSLAINYTAYGTLRSKWLERDHPYRSMGTVSCPH